MVYLVVVSCIWAFSFPLIKGVLTGVDPATVAAVRLLLSLAVFLPLLRPQRVSIRLGLALVCIGAVQFGLMYVLYIATYRYLPAHVIVLMTTTTPLFVTLVNDTLGRRLHTGFLLSASLAVAAGVVIQYPDQPLRMSALGVVLLQASNLAFAFGQVAYKRLAESRPQWRDERVFGLLYAGAVMVSLAFALRSGIPSLAFTARQMVVLAYLGLVASGLCFFMWNRGARSVSAGTLAVMNNLKIPLGVAASLLLLGEQTDYVRLVLGMALMGCALYLNGRRKTAVPQAT